MLRPSHGLVPKEKHHAPRRDGKQAPRRNHYLYSSERFRTAWISRIVSYETSVALQLTPITSPLILLVFSRSFIQG